MLSIISFGKQNKVNNAFKCQNPYTLKSNITKRLPKWHYGYLFGIFGGQHTGFSCLLTKCIYLLLLLIFFLFQIKTWGFHLKEEGKELLGMLMAALAK